MKKLTAIQNLQSDEALFEYFMATLKRKGITSWNYYVNWDKVNQGVAPFKNELHLLNSLIGERDVHAALKKLLLEYPKVINAIPLLLAIRFNAKATQKIDILTDELNYHYENFDLSIDTPNETEAGDIATFFIKSGLGAIVADKKVTNLVDYATGVEVGMDSNGRKNRGGQQMERLVVRYIDELCSAYGLEYLKEANAKTIKDRWGIDIVVDKSSRRLDYVIKNKHRLFFFEVNFYHGGGSKLKSTATEYIKMNEYWNQQKIDFVWITDGAGWLSARLPLKEYFDKAEYLVNLEMLKNGVLKHIIVDES